MSRPFAVVLALLVLSACGSSSTTATPAAAPTPTPMAAAPLPAVPPSASPSASPSPSAPASPKVTGKYVFPVIGKASYAHTHHDYPASDIIAACGLTAVAPVDGTVLEVTAVDTWTRKANLGATRGGLSVSILGADGARYYLSHFSAIDAGIEPGARVTAGEPIAKVGRTGDAGACHVHFGLSPACANTGDWWTRRGTIYPWPYLDAWRAHKVKSPVAELAAWKAQHGCPSKPTVDP
jgi:murein DD-endopeptidase MepM/ murein hydrolase activator NlpD